MVTNEDTDLFRSTVQSLGFRGEECEQGGWGVPGGLVFEAHILLNDSTKGSNDLIGPVTRVKKKKMKKKVSSLLLYYSQT